jgi:hypothetical protein
MDSTSRSRLVGSVFFYLTIGWTILLVALTLWDITELKKRNTDNLTSQARSFYKLIVTTRHWNASHGGVYVPVTGQTQPNPYLDVAERDIVKDSGQKLTLINPAYMTRQLSELSQQTNGVTFNITSLKPIRPENAPAKWEADLLAEFDQVSTEKYYWFADPKTGAKSFRYMSALWTQKECLKCHAFQGYKEGDLRGGISVSVSADQVLARQAKDIIVICLTHLLLWFLGLIGSYVSYGLIKTGVDERESLIEKLSQSLREIKTLRGLLPICASCKKIRNDDGAWEVIESYLKERAEVEFSHGICPDCVRKLYPEHADKILEE